MHLGFSVGLLAIEVPVFKIHIGLVSRNELGQEWKNNLNYVANQTSMGDGIPVEELDDEEYNHLFDEKAFVYDKSWNRWDQGFSINCWNFWCWSCCARTIGEHQWDVGMRTLDVGHLATRLLPCY